MPSRLSSRSLGRSSSARRLNPSQQGSRPTLRASKSQRSVVVQVQSPSLGPDQPAAAPDARGSVEQHWWRHCACSSRCTVVACLALLGVIGVTLMIVDDSPGGQQGRVAGIWCLCITGVFAVLFTVYIAHYEWHLSRREQRARYISKLPDCALCKLPLDGLCSQNHDWMRKKHMSDMSPRSLRRCKDKRGKLSPAFRELLCPVSEGKCGHRLHYHCVMQMLRTDKSETAMCPIGPWVWEFRSKSESSRVLRRLRSERSQRIKALALDESHSQREDPSSKGARRKKKRGSSSSARRASRSPRRSAVSTISTSRRSVSGRRLSRKGSSDSMGSEGSRGSRGSRGLGRVPPLSKVQATPGRVVRHTKPAKSLPAFPASSATSTGPTSSRRVRRSGSRRRLDGSLGTSGSATAGPPSKPLPAFG